MFHRDLVRQTASASTIPPGTGFPPRFEKRAASVGVGVPNWIVESKIDNDVCRFRAPLPSSATPVRSNHRPTFTKKTFSTDNGRDTYGKFMTEPMWKRLDEDYYVDVYTKCVLQFEYNFSKDEWILGVINSDDSRLFYRLLYRFEIRESFNRVVTYRQRMEKSTNSSWRKHE